jgi:phytanoyl-CoA hydroxylase
MITIDVPIPNAKEPGLSDAKQSSAGFTSDEVAQFWRDGYLCVRDLATRDDVAHMRRVTEAGLRDQTGPIEYEAELHYPGAPPSLDAVGGRTIRRLKQALSRDFLFTEWMLRPAVLGRLQQLLGPQIVCPLAHHNCIMTKQPQFSSETGWHQDIRYWSYARPELVNVWIALGREHAANGCLQVIPGSHRLELDRSRFDADVFFRTDLPENQPLIQTRQFVELEPGDVLFFHCKTLHSASRNTSSESKYSAVFTFHGGDNHSLRDTRSSALPELLLTPGR